GICISLNKKIRDKRNDNDYSIVNLTEKTVIGLDPGRRDLCVTVDDNERVIQIGTKQYHHMANFIRNRRKQKKFRRIKFDNYVGKQKALSIICRKIIGNKKDHYSNSVVIAYGAGSFSSSSRGHAS
ncbi:2111_t:CDS:2, partial [Funneliformis geosporum]